MKNLLRGAMTAGVIAAGGSALAADGDVARGATLVDGTGGCGACHTPRAADGTTAADASAPTYLAGAAMFDGSYAISLRADADGLLNWTEQDIVDTLRTARNAHSAVLGPAMAGVVVNTTQAMPDEDLHAIAAYLKSLAPSDQSTASYTPDSATHDAFADGSITGRGAEMYQDSCSACHMTTGLGATDVFPAMAGNPTILAPEPHLVVVAILQGSQLPPTATRPAIMGMPGFAWRYSDAEVAELVTFLRSSWGNDAPAIDADYVKAIRDQLTEDLEADAPDGGELAGEYDPRNPL
ncbi:membrane-bound D-gluconate 2-dehydrogenase cytochrome c subunit [Ketogulonicigenium robustum]|uniref:Membrane-bound D-gluconate 2-dehydrogenase cytochrome c subunit n=1 Tax=Ketogulonicigenium robustum TaxID=92947 RepID=A0A1W6P1B5_9RHOB|nr:cytochrome c [Ketogulonicigenium robustum]ARO15296.1 membrane-bound D-gluconate 2-dehydrogenase cytochrome c subunit [Ketogulonicigenium robustum]